MTAQKRDPWLLSFSKALKSWIDIWIALTPEARYRKDFADAIGLTSGWSHLISGGSYAPKETFALLYFLTEVEEADPRTLPDRLVYNHQKGTKIPSPRRMTPEQYRHWVGEHRLMLDQLKETIGARAVIQAINPPLTEDTAQLPEDFRKIIDELIEQQLDERLGRRPKQSTRGHLEALIKRFQEAYDDMSPNTRDLLMANHGEQMTQLWTLLNTLVHPEADRERSIRMSKEI